MKIQNYLKTGKSLSFAKNTNVKIFMQMHILLLEASVTPLALVEIASLQAPARRSAGRGLERDCFKETPIPQK
jgi:hypothetical protein